MSAQETLLTPPDATVTASRRSNLTRTNALAIAMSDDLVAHHTYDIIRAAAYVTALGEKLHAEIRRRYEKGTI